jgi:hypothetical protein
VGFFIRGTSHFRPEIRMPEEPWTFFELDMHWRRWAQLENRRRTTYFMYILDTLATIETSTPRVLAPTDISRIPLPTPGALWTAPTCELWLAAAKTYHCMTLDDLMRFLFDKSKPIDAGPPDRFTDRLTSSLSHFALNAAVITLLQGILDMGEGRRERGDWTDLTSLWVEREEAESWALGTFPESLTREALLGLYASAMEKVRRHPSLHSLTVVEEALG